MKDLIIVQHVQSPNYLQQATEEGMPNEIRKWIRTEIKNHERIYGQVFYGQIRQLAERKREIFYSQKNK